MTEKGGSSTDREDLKLALDYAWGWFSLHSSQRMQLMNFLILSLALTTAAYAGAIGNKKYWVAAAIAISGALLCVVFERLDIRTRELVQVSEPTLAALETEVRRRAGLAELTFVEAIEHPRHRFTSYRAVLRVLTRVGAVLFVAALIYALVVALK